MTTKTILSERILLFSGGLDSFIAWHYLNYPPVLFMKAGQSYESKEFATVKYFSSRYKNMELHIDESINVSSWEEPNDYIPYRNVFFTMVASLYAPLVYLVGIRGDSVDDNNPAATNNMGRFYNNFNHNESVKITSPFYEMSKSQIIRWYLKSGLSQNDLLRTRSCYDNRSKNQCGKCGSCFRRWVAFENNGIKERYDSPPWQWGEAANYIQKMKIGLYDPLRTEETLLALRKYVKV